MLAALYAAFLVFAFAFVGGNISGVDSFAITSALLALGCFAALPRSYFITPSNRAALLVLVALAFIGALVKLSLEQRFDALVVGPFVLETALLIIMCVEIFAFGRREAGSAV